MEINLLVSYYGMVAILLFNFWDNKRVTLVDVP